MINKPFSYLHDLSSVPTLQTTETIPNDAKYPSAAATTSTMDTTFLSKTTTTTSRVLPTRPRPFRQSQSSPQGCCSFSLGLRSSSPATRVPFMAFSSVLRLSFLVAASLFVVETPLKDVTFLCCADTDSFFGFSAHSWPPLGL